MLGKKKNGPPQRPFAHNGDCLIAKLNPAVADVWQEIDTGHWHRECQCGAEDWHRPAADDRVRQDPLDPKTMRHFGQCEHRDATDPALVKAPLTIHERDYGWYVVCNRCKSEWQVLRYLEGAA
jgi:hypothetical protein